MKKTFKRCGEGENVCNCKSEKECGYLSEEYQAGMAQAEQDLDFDHDIECCEKCQSEKVWEDCYQCGGEGGRGYEDDLQFEDPLWYEPGDFEMCDICEGKGGYYLCLSSKCRNEG